MAGFMCDIVTPVAKLVSDAVSYTHLDVYKRQILMSANGKRIDASVLSQLESARNVLKLSTDGGEC